MQMLKLKKPIKTVVKSYAKDAEGKVAKDEKGNDVVASERSVSIDNVEVPQYSSLAECVQVAGSEDKVLAYINASAKADAVSPIRVVGAKYTTDNSDTEIVTAGRELGSKFNPFEDRRKGEGVKALADKYKELQTLMDSGASDSDILAALKAGKL